MYDLYRLIFIRSIRCLMVLIKMTVGQTVCSIWHKITQINILLYLRCMQLDIALECSFPNSFQIHYMYVPSTQYVESVITVSITDSLSRVYHVIMLFVSLVTVTLEWNGYLDEYLFLPFQKRNENCTI